MSPEEIKKLKYTRETASKVNQTVLFETMRQVNNNFELGQQFKGTIYLIEPEPQVCKIGITTGHPKKRLQDLSHNLYDKSLKIRYYTKTHSIRWKEKSLHQMFKSFNIKNEWFAIDAEDVVWYTKRFFNWIHGDYLPNDNFLLEKHQMV